MSEPFMCGDRRCAQLLDEYRAEVRSLRVVLAAVEKRRHRFGAEVELTVKEGRAHWVVTTSNPASERLLATMVAEHIGREIGRAFRLVGLVMTGSGREDKTPVEAPAPPETDAPSDEVATGSDQ